VIALRLCAVSAASISNPGTSASSHEAAITSNAHGSACFIVSRHKMSFSAMPAAVSKAVVNFYDWRAHDCLYSVTFFIIGG
jgi:hypothetical protein